MKVLANLEWCFSHAVKADISENIGKCFLHTTGIPCSSSINVRILSNSSTELTTLICI